MVGAGKKARSIGDEYSAVISKPASRCTLTWWFDKVKGGVEKHASRLNLFRQSPFAFLLHVTSFSFIGAIFHLLLVRYIGDLVFEIKGRRLQFSEMDFALITGLKIGDLTVPKNTRNTSTLRDKYFKEYPVLKKHLMEVFERLVDTNKHEDVVKVALLLVVECFLRGTEPKTMCNMDYIHMVDSLDDFYMYPWGSLGYITMSQGIESALAVSSSPRYTVCGCVLPLQVWAVEILPALQECVVSYVPHQIPRFIQYRGWKCWRYKRIHAIVESKATSVVMKLEPTLREWETDAVRSVRDSFQLTQTQEDEDGNEIDHGEDDESDDNDDKGVEGEGPRGGIPRGGVMRNVIFMEEFRIEREELKKEREDLKKERDELRKEKEGMRRREEMFVEKENMLLKEKKQLMMEKDLFFAQLWEKLANEREEFNKKEGSRTQRGCFVMEEEGEELMKRGEVNDDTCEEPGHGDVDVQSHSNVKGNVLTASTSHPVYERRTKRVPKPSYYKISPYLSLSAIDTTRGPVPKPEQVTTFATFPIPFPLQMDPFRILSAHEVKEVEDWYEANKHMETAKWFSTIWIMDAWVESEAIDRYIEFLQKRHNDHSISYPQDCKFCPTYFTQSLEGCLPILIAYRASKSALERAELIGQLNTVYAIAKPRDVPYTKAIWGYERVYAPINHENSHWFLLVIYPRLREIVVVDSLCTNVLPKYKQQMRKMTDALPILFHATGDNTALEGNKWTVRVDEYAPKQDNGNDCGIFVMKFIDILCSGLNLEGTDMQKFVARWRKSIAYDCLSVICR